MQDIRYYLVGTKLYFVHNKLKLEDRGNLTMHSCFIADRFSDGSILVIKNRYNGKKFLFENLRDFLSYCRDIYPGVQSHLGAEMIDCSYDVECIIKKIKAAAACAGSILSMEEALLRENSRMGELQNH